MTFSLPKAIREKELAKEIREDIHPLILKRAREKEREMPQANEGRSSATDIQQILEAGVQAQSLLQSPDIRESVAGDD